MMAAELNESERDMRQVFCAYCRTLGQIWHDKKGHHDIVDFLEAALFVAVTSGAVYGVIKFISSFH